MICALRAISIGVVLAATVGASLSVLAQDKDLAPSAQPWRVVLAQQLRREKNCDLNELLYFNEMELGGDVALDGRVTCIDGRMYDFSRPRVHQKFEIRLCEPTVC